MHFTIFEDEFEPVYESRPCTACGGDLRKCSGACNGMVSFGLRRRAPEDVAKLRAERQQHREDEILAEADAIRARRRAQGLTGVL